MGEPHTSRHFYAQHKQRASGLCTHLDPPGKTDCVFVHSLTHTHTVKASAQNTSGWALLAPGSSQKHQFHVHGDQSAHQHALSGAPHRQHARIHSPSDLASARRRGWPLPRRQGAEAECLCSRPHPAPFAPGLDDQEQGSAVSDPPDQLARQTETSSINTRLPSLSCPKLSGNGQNSCACSDMKFVGAGPAPPTWHQHVVVAGPFPASSFPAG